MKKVILLGGPYGVGKTTLANNIVNNVKRSIMLDGEWAWYQGNHWNFSPENKKMALDNICHTLRNFLENPNFDTIIFSWVMHKFEDHETIVNSLRETNVEFELYDLSLICSEETLLNHLKERIIGKATEFDAYYSDDLISSAHEGSVKKLEKILTLPTQKINIDGMTKDEVLENVLSMIGLKKEEQKLIIRH